MVASSERVARSRRLARVEVLAGIAAFALVLLTWALQLFAPLYELNGFCISCHPRYGRVSLVDSVGGLGNFVRYDPGHSYALLILAFLVAAGIVAVGAWLHGGRGVALGRWLVWVGSLLEALLLPAVVYTMITIPLPLTPVMPFQIAPRGDTLMLGLGICAGLAVIASVAARRPGQVDETASEGSLVARTTRGRRLARVEVFAGVAAFALALLTWAISLFAPLYQDISSCDQVGCLRIKHVSLVEGLGGLGTFLGQHSSFLLLILVFLIVTGELAVGAWLHGGRRMVVGRSLIWSGSFLVPVVVSMISELSPLALLPSYLVVRLVLPYQEWLGGGTISGLDLLVLVVASSLCAGLAVIASVAAVRADVA